MQRRARGALEAEVFDLVRSAGRPVTVAEVTAGLDAPAAYTTVMTTLTRLHDDEMLTREHRGRAFAYSSTPSCGALTSTRGARGMRRLLDRSADRADVLGAFVAGLTPADDAVLRQLLAEHHLPVDRASDHGRDDPGAGSG